MIQKAVRQSVTDPMKVPSGTPSDNAIGVPTMAAASGYKLLKIMTDPALASALTDNLTTLLLGNVVAFLVALAAIRFFIGFLTKHGFKAFGYYRIAVGLLILAFGFWGGKGG